MRARFGTNPVSTVEQAVWWLVGHSLATADFIDASLSLDDMPVEALLVCDVFWLTPETLRRRLIIVFREVDVSSRSKSSAHVLRRWSHD